VASDLFTDSIFGSDGRDWLDMASGSGHKSSSQAKSTTSDRPRSEESVTDTDEITKPGINIACLFFTVFTFQLFSVFIKILLLLDFYFNFY